MPKSASPRSTKISERRRAARGNVKVLVAFRCPDEDAPIQDGFARAVSLSPEGALLELPDLYKKGQSFDLEFLLDNNLIAPVKGTVVRVAKRKDLYKVAIEFSKVPAKIKQLIKKQIDA